MPTFTDAFQALRDVQSSKSPNTIAQCNSVLKHLEPWFTANANDLQRFCTGKDENGEDVPNYEQIWSLYKAAQAKIPKANGEPRKLSHDRRYLVQALKRAERKGWITKSFKKSDFDLFEASEPIGQHVDDGRVKLVFEKMRDVLKHPKGLCQATMAATMGMRKTEILGLTKDEVDFNKRIIRLKPKRIKTRQARKADIPITDDVFPLLKHFYEEAQGNYIFPKIDTRTRGPRNPIVIWDQPQTSNTHVWTAARQLAGDWFRFHDLRHTCASNLLSAGYPETYICQVLGMSREMLQKIYAHQQTKDQEKFRQATSGRFGVTANESWFSPAKLKNAATKLLKRA